MKHAWTLLKMFPPWASKQTLKLQFHTTTETIWIVPLNNDRYNVSSSLWWAVYLEDYRWTIKKHSQSQCVLMAYCAKRNDTILNYHTSYELSLLRMRLLISQAQHPKRQRQPWHLKSSQGISVYFACCSRQIYFDADLLTFLTVTHPRVLPE